MSATSSAKARMERILRLQEEIDGIKSDIRDIYAEEKAEGGDKTAMGLAITKIRKRAKDKTSFDEREVMTDVYLSAFDAPSIQPSHTYARVKGGQPASNGEKAVRPESAASSVEEIAAFIEPGTAEQAEPEAAAEVAGNDLREPVAAEQGQIIREGDAPRETDRFCGDASSSDTESQMDRATEGSFETGSEAAEKGRKAIPAGPEGVDLNHAGAGESPATSCEYCDGTGDVHRIDGEWLGYCHCEEGQRLKAAPVPPIASASQGEAEVPSVEGVNPNGEPRSPDANTGGIHVTAPVFAATHQAGGSSSKTPATHPLRPNCLNPSSCAGYGSNHCHGCKVAMREGEAA